MDLDLPRLTDNRPRPGRRAITAATVAVAALATAGSAQAATYCVADAACVAAGGASSATIDTALTAARTSKTADTVKIGAGTFVGNFDTGVTGSPVSIVGAGRGKTILKPAGGGGFPKALTLQATPTVPVSASDLTISLTGANTWGLQLIGGASAVRVDIDGAATTNSTGVSMEPGSFEDGKITMPGTDDLGVNVITGGSTVRRAELDTYLGIEAYSQIPAGTLITQSSIVTTRIAVALTRGSLRLEDSVIDARKATSGRILDVSNSNGGASAHLTVQSDTVVGDPAHVNVPALAVYAASDDQHLLISVRDSILTGFAGSVRRYAAGGQANVTFDHSVHGPVETDINAGTGQGAITDTAGLGDPPSIGFVDAAASEFRLSATSPLVDAGSAGPLAADEGALDRAGLPRIADGNRDGQAVRDVGAYEFPSAAVIDDAPPLDPAMALATAGTTSAGDAGGAAAAPAAVPTPSTVQAAGTGAGPAQTGDHVAPTLSKLGFLRSKGRSASKQAGTLTYGLSEPATVTVSLARRVGKRWVAVTGTVVGSGVAGGNTLPLPRTIGGKRLSAGTYRATVVARDAAGNLGVAAALTFAVKAV